MVRLQTMLARWQYGEQQIHEGALKEHMRAAAQKRVKGSMLLDAVAKKEAIAVSEEEIDERLTEIARMQGITLAKARSDYAKEGRLEALQRAIREEKALAQLEDLAPEDIAPMVVFLASDDAANVNGQFFLCAGGSISLLSQPRAIKTIFKADAAWTLAELEETVPLTLADGLTNPAPPRQAT